MNRLRFLLALVFAFVSIPLPSRSAPVANPSATFRILSVVGSYTDLSFDSRPGRDATAIAISRAPSPPYLRPSGDKLVLYRMLAVPAGAAPDAKPVKEIAAEIPLPAGELPLLIVVAPIPDGKLAAKVLTDDPAKHPAGMLRLINFSTLPAMIAINDARYEANPAESKFIPQGTGGTLLQVAVQQAGRWDLAFRKERLFRPELRSYGFIFNYSPDPELGAEPTPPPAIFRLINEKAPALPSSPSS